MMNKLLKLIVFFLFILSGSFLWVGRKSISPYIKWGEFDPQITNFGHHPGVLIIFNSGGWGNTAFEEAEDFSKVVRGIRATLHELGWKKTIVVSYGRTQDNVKGRILGMKDILSSFSLQSENLAEKTRIFLWQNPKSKVLMTGLSMGADFVGETMEKISQNHSVFAIIAGTPFWGQHPGLKNTLEIINEKDIVATGDYKTLVIVSIKGALKWLVAKIKGHGLHFTQAIRIPGHRYDWKSPLVKNQIISFLGNNLCHRRNYT